MFVGWCGLGFEVKLKGGEGVAGWASLVKTARKKEKNMRIGYQKMADASLAVILKVFDSTPCCLRELELRLMQEARVEHEAISKLTRSSHELTAVHCD